MMSTNHSTWSDDFRFDPIQSTMFHNQIMRKKNQQDHQGGFKGFGLRILGHNNKKDDG